MKQRFAAVAQTGRVSNPLCVEALEDRFTPSANVLVTTHVGSEQLLREYTPNGSLVRSVTIEPGGPAEDARDLVVDGSGNIHIYNGTTNPYLSTLDAGTETWSHRTHAGWSTTSSTGYGGLAVHGDSVFATDRFTGGTGTPKGIIHFDLATGTSTRFSTSYSYNDLTLGLDGSLYALDSRTVRVFDPDTFALERTVTLPSSVNGQSQIYRGIAVNALGEIFAASWQEMLHRFDANGVAQQSMEVTGPPTGLFSNLTDIDISADG